MPLARVPHTLSGYRATAPHHHCVRAELRFGPRVRFTHGKGASASWIFFATPAGSTTRYIVKVCERACTPAQLRGCLPGLRL